MPTFKEHSISQQANMLAMKLPDGCFWRGKYIETSNLRSYLIAIGYEYMRLEERLNYAGVEFNLNTTSDLIEEFEVEYAIATSCFSSTSSSDLAQRIQNILTIIGANGVSTDAQFEALAVILGLTVEVTAGLDPVNAGLSVDDTQARFRIFIRQPATGGFTYTFPITFTDPITTLFECFIKKLKPANVELVFLTL